MRVRAGMGALVAAGLAAVAAGCGGSGPSASQIASAAGAQSCDNSGFAIISKLSNSKETIYDCTFSSGAVKCVTYANGIANDSSAVVRLLFSTALGTNKPSCLSG